MDDKDVKRPNPDRTPRRDFTEETGGQWSDRYKKRMLEESDSYGERKRPVRNSDAPRVYERGDRSPSARREREAGGYMNRSYAGRRKRKKRMKPQIKMAIAISAVLVVVAVSIMLIIFIGNRNKESGGKNPQINVAGISDPPTKMPEVTPVVTQVADASTTPGEELTPVLTAEPTAAPAALPYSDAKKEEIQYEKGLYILRDSAYEPYTYVEATAQAYADAVNAAAEKLTGVKIYDSVIPLSSGIIFPDHLRADINSTDQQVACTKLSEKMSSSVNYVNIYNALNDHRSEYIYYRTDHHWTGRGAYYAYVEIMKAMGKTPKPLSMYTVTKYEGFTGSFWNDTKLDALKANPDYVEAYDSGVSTSMEITQKDGKTFAWPMLKNVDDYSATMKYSCYVGGDYPLIKIENRDLKDGSAIILVKESFGNAFAPFLADHYQYVYIVDYRYYTKSFSALVKETGAKEVIFLNNIGMTRSKPLVANFTKCVKS